MTKPRPVGRPLSNLPKRKPHQVRLTDQEWLEITQAANAELLESSTWIRKVCLNLARKQK